MKQTEYTYNTKKEALKEKSFHNRIFPHDKFTIRKVNLKSHKKNYIYYVLQKETPYDKQIKKQRSKYV